MTTLQYRDSIAVLSSQGRYFAETWHIVQEFERIIADFFGAAHGVAVDCCTHALELVLRDIDWREHITLPAHTYMSVPMMLDHLHIPYSLRTQCWREAYEVVPGYLWDAATLWRSQSHQPRSVTCVSFQFRKHLSLGRGGMILLDDADQAQRLRRMCHDGRSPELTQWQQDITELGYHYYMTPETAALGLLQFEQRRDSPYRAWSWQDYRDLRELSYFRHHAES
jgi:dTDP-4-amino-4,6-dideoxygalactose transaminase